MLAVRTVWRAALARLYASALYRWRFAIGRHERLLLAPQDLRAADPTRATEIIEGDFTFAGKTVRVEHGSPFAVEPPSPAWSEALLGFSWLRHLRAVEDQGRRTARTLLSAYLRSPRRFSADALNPATTARRVLCWACQAPLALDGAEAGFYRAFVRSLAWQMHYLLRAGKVGPDGFVRLLCAIAAMQISLCLVERGGARRRAVRWLADELSRQILPDGVHVSRNPQVIVELLLDLLPLRQSFASRNLPPPPELLNAIDRLMPMLRFFRHTDGAFAAFNGMGYTQLHLVATLLAYDDTRGKPVQNAPHGGYQRAEAGGSVLIVDTGVPPPLASSFEAHAGVLSFEFSADTARLVVNCGAPMNGRDSWRQAARATPAHSTAVVDDTSSAAFASAGRARRPIVAGPKRVSVERQESAQGTTLVVSHDGYKADLGLVHERMLTLGADGILTGRDDIFGDAQQPWRGEADVVLRFHMHPTVALQDGGDGASVTLAPPGSRSWIFRADAGTVSIEESIHFANPEGPRRSAQIVVTMPRDDSRAVMPVSWLLEPLTPRFS